MPPTSELPAAVVAPGRCIATGGTHQGSLGCFVRDQAGAAHLMTNYHVLAAAGALSGARVFALPAFASPLDSGFAFATFRGDLTVFDLDGDVALARLDDGVAIQASAAAWPAPLLGIRSPVQGERLCKLGAATATAMFGVVQELDVTQRSRLDGGQSTRVGCFSIQGETGFCLPGDSGALWVGEDGHAVGLHFAARNAVKPLAFACPLPRIFTRLQLELMI